MQYVTSGLQRGPTYLPSCPELEPTSSTSTRPGPQLRGSTTPVPDDQFLSRQSRRRRLETADTWSRPTLFERWPTSQPNSQPASQPASQLS
ncbi:hypothetical protein EAG_06835 [Camponotus floridanus]|uniref:Uncharacterized protein n=1 Tax=Camponotus floridanus TaxID=104421 RepID=E2A1H8_CAMFO|nr:hypothetical protein EAG_06835 [Camponotus floridanus]